MTISGLLVHDVVILHPADITDRYNNVVKAWTGGTETTVKGWISQRSQLEDHDQREAQVSEWILFLHPDATITGADRVRWEGITFEVEGPANPAWTPRGYTTTRCRFVWSQADFVILVPMLGRAHRVKPLLASIEAATPEATVLFLTTPEDVDVRDAVSHSGHKSILVPYRPVGDYARKINEGVAHTGHDLIFTGADDLHFHPGWFEHALAMLDERAGVIGTWDMSNRRTKWDHSTHSLVTREYAERGTIDEPGKLLHEGYVHEYVDDEMVGTAKHRKAYRHCRKAVVEHLHPMVGKAPLDGMYEAQGERMATSRDLFRERRRLWT